MPRPYLRHVSTKPTKIVCQAWIQWYREEHIRDMVYHKVARTAAFYQAIGAPLTYLQPVDGTVDQMDYLAIYQVDQPRPQDQQAFKDHVRVRSTLLGEDDPHISDVADLVMEDLELVEVLGSYEFNEDVAPYILHARLSGEEVEGKLQFEHVNAVSKLDGYRRSLLYRCLDREGRTPSIVLLHEFESVPEDVGAVNTEMEAIEPSKDCAFQLRSFELLGYEGFGGQCRMPEGRPKTPSSNR